MIRRRLCVNRGRRRRVRHFHRAPVTLRLDSTAVSGLCKTEATFRSLFWEVPGAVHCEAGPCPHPLDPVNLTGSDLSVTVAVTSLYYNDVTAGDEAGNAIANMETRPPVCLSAGESR